MDFEGRPSPAAEPPASPRWRILEEEADACAVLTRRMEVVYLNEAARALVPPRWFGARCWEVFPVGDTSCASTCPAARSVSRGDSITWCEETVYVAGAPVELGVAVIPLAREEADGGRAVVMLRPKPAGVPVDEVRIVLLEHAEELRTALD